MENIEFDVILDTDEMCTQRNAQGRYACSANSTIDQLLTEKASVLTGIPADQLYLTFEVWLLERGWNLRQCGLGSSDTNILTIHRYVQREEKSAQRNEKKVHHPFDTPEAHMNVDETDGNMGGTLGIIREIGFTGLGSSAGGGSGSGTGGSVQGVHGCPMPIVRGVKTSADSSWITKGFIFDAAETIEFAKRLASGQTTVNLVPRLKGVRDPKNVFEVSSIIVQMPDRSIQKFSSVDDMWTKFVGDKLAIYENQQQRTIDRLKSECEKTSEIVRFVSDINARAIDINCPLAEVVDQLKARRYVEKPSMDSMKDESKRGKSSSYEYLLDAPIRDLTEEGALKLTMERDSMWGRVELLKEKSAAQSWIDDLSALEKTGDRGESSSPKRARLDDPVQVVLVASGDLVQSTGETDQKTDGVVVE